MFIKYKGEVVNTSLVFGMKTYKESIKFTGPSENRNWDFTFGGESQAKMVLEQIYINLSQGWECFDIDLYLNWFLINNIMDIK